MKIKDLSVRVIVFIFFLFVLFFSNKMSDVLNGTDTCLCSYDGFGYYMYTPHLINEGSYAMNSEWAQNLQNEYCYGSYVYQLVKAENGNEINIYHMGLSFVQTPSYLLGELGAHLFGFKKDGFSIPYYISFLLNVLAFILIGLIYLRKLLKLFFTEQVTALIILSLYLGTNILITFGLSFSLTHLYLFTLNTIFLYHLFRFLQSNSRKALIYSAIFLGLTVCIRPTQVLLGLIPVFLIFHSLKGNKIEAIKKLLWFPLFGLIWNIPQIMYWYVIGGHFIMPNMHTEEIIIVDPNILDFLFSYKKGWLLYSPLFLLLIVGLIHIYKEKRHFFWMSVTFISIYIWVMSSWECWWYASSFGSRVMVDIYPFLAIILGFAFVACTKKSHKLLISIYCSLCILLSLLQSSQSIDSFLHHERMTKEHYWYIFGKSNIENYSDIRLEIDRGNTDWINSLDKYSSIGIDHEYNTVLSVKDTLVTIPGQSLSIDKFELLSRVPNDETCFTVSFDARTSDSTKSALIQMETVSIYNCYSWNNYEISLNNKQNEFTHYTFQYNLRNLRHTKDQMQVYIYNENEVTIEIANLKIEAVTLIR